MSDAKLGYGSQFYINNGTTLTKLAEVTSISLPNEQTDEVDVSHLESPGRTREFIAGLIDPGEITIEMNYLAGSTTDDLILDAKADADVRPMKVVVPAKTANQQFLFSGIVKGYDRGQMTIDGKQTATITIRISGAVVQSAVA